MSAGLVGPRHDQILIDSRAVAGLDGSENIEPKHISEAINHRLIDRNYWM